jgi:hypothetical protein
MKESERRSRLRSMGVRARQCRARTREGTRCTATALGDFVFCPAHQRMPDVRVFRSDRPSKPRLQSPRIEVVPEPAPAKEEAPSEEVLTWARRLGLRQNEQGRWRGYRYDGSLVVWQSSSGPWFFRPKPSAPDPAQQADTEEEAIVGVCTALDPHERMRGDNGEGRVDLSNPDVKKTLEAAEALYQSGYSVSDHSVVSRRSDEEIEAESERSVGKRLRWLRMRSNKTLGDLARFLECSVSEISAIEVDMTVEERRKMVIPNGICTRKPDDPEGPV